MFNVKHNECVGFESRWKIKKVSSVAATQTSESSTQDASSNTAIKRAVQMQTDSEVVFKEPEVDEEHLAQWLKKIMPQVTAELNESIHSKAFKGYQVSAELSDPTCKLLQTVTVNSDVSGCTISALSWNSTGKILAVSCIYVHGAWCTHQGVVYIYPLTKEDMLPQDYKLKLTADSCITAVKFHVNMPSIVCAGTFAGEIVIWNIQHDTEEILVKINGHNDRLTQLNWIINSEKNVNLISSALDGYMKVWNFNAMNSSLKLKTRYMIKSPVLGRFPNFEVDDALDDDKSNEKPTSVKAIRSVLCFDFSKFVSNKFVIAAEGGLVAECSTFGTTKLNGSTENEPLEDPIYKYYVPHKGEITSISFSPNVRDLFMTCGSDGEIRVYVLGQEEAAQTLFARKLLGCLTWVPFEEKLIAGCGEKNIIEIYNLMEAKRIENTTTEKMRRGMLTKMEINTKKSNLVAAGSEDGKIYFWKVPWALFANM